jgi:hypothetical protein
VSLALGDLGPQDPFQPPPERRRDSDAFVKGLDLTFELGGWDVACLRAVRAESAAVTPGRAAVAAS